MDFNRVVMNLSGAKKRYEVLDGKQYLVVPTVMITEGVWNGSEGPLYYPPEELARDPLSWNHKPVVVYHPTMSGQGISACDPLIVEKQGVGLLFNTSYDGRTKSECWLDEVKLAKVDNRVLEAIERGETVEVSTGMYNDFEMKAGEWNGKSYKGIVRNIRPDHLAILPDQKGACSVADGAGLLRNADGEVLSYDDIREQIRGLIKAKSSFYCYVCDLYPKYAVYDADDGKFFKIGYKTKGGKVFLDGEPEAVRKMTHYVTDNGKLLIRNSENGPVSVLKPSGDLSLVMRRQQLQSALTVKYGGITPDAWAGWVVQDLGSEVVWFKDGKYFLLPYTYSDDKIVFGDGQEQEVELQGGYKPKIAPPNTNQGPNVTTTNIPTKNVAGEVTADGVRVVAENNRKLAVDQIIKGGKWSDKDRAWLEGLTDEYFGKIAGSPPAGDPANAPYNPSVPDRSNVHGPGVGTTNAADYINSAPPEIRDILQNALQTQNEEKERTIQTILVNKNNPFSKEFLLTKKLPELRGIALLAGGHGRPRPAGNYGGADVPMFLATQPQQTQNSGQDDGEVLPMPGMNFEKKAV